MARSASTYRTELQHVLDASGNLVPLPQAAEKLGRQLCGIVAWVTRLPCSEFDSTNVICSVPVAYRCHHAACSPLAISIAQFSTNLGLNKINGKPYYP